MRFQKKQYLIYLGFAIVSIMLNIGVQLLTELIMKFTFPDLSSVAFTIFSKDVQMWFVLALIVGTVAGFIFKFIVDKWIVFQDKLSEKESIEKTTQQLIKYFLFAILTTMIFWGTEGAFYLFVGEQWYALGGIIGLIIGYTVKFFLDSSFVFVNTHDR